MASYFYQDGLDLKKGNIKIPPTSRPDFGSCHVFAFPKSGSVLLNNIVEVMMREHHIPFVNIPNYFHQEGISLDSVLFDSNTFAAKGYCYAGHRRAPPSLAGCLNQLPGQKILMVRDPRDMLVSMFYSIKYSHGWPAKGTEQFFFKLRSLQAYTDLDIDAFCISCVTIYISGLDNYLDLLGDRNTKIIRYEDVIFKKIELARIICEWFSLRFSSRRLEELVAPFDVKRSDERPNEHVRQVEPGDHKRKLQSSTIEFMNIAFADFMRKFNYPI